jgi:hypothetical protein
MEKRNLPLIQKDSRKLHICFIVYPFLGLDVQVMFHKKKEPTLSSATSHSEHAQLLAEKRWRKRSTWECQHQKGPVFCGHVLWKSMEHPKELGNENPNDEMSPKRGFGKHLQPLSLESVVGVKTHGFPVDVPCWKIQKKIPCSRSRS